MLCVSRAVHSVVLGAWSVRCVGWAGWVDCRCFLSSVFLSNARRLELSPCNTYMHDHNHSYSSPNNHITAPEVSRRGLHSARALDTDVSSSILIVSIELFRDMREDACNSRQSRCSAGPRDSGEPSHGRPLIPPELRSQRIDEPTVVCPHLTVP